jgi:predicted RNase H-like HicB family nuclease
MDHIEASRQPDGRWVATVTQIPGLAAFGQSQMEVLVRARKLYALMLEEDMQIEARIHAFHPGEMPDSSQPEGSF